MSFFISDAWAQPAGAPAQPDPFLSFLPLILLFVIFYFLLIRPQAKRAKEHKKLVSELKPGDEVVTSGGLAGRIREVGESYVTLEIADGVEVKLQKMAVTGLLPKGSLKSLS